ncbi:MAG: hypothetical protein GX921_08195 [Bacteroidales bacterium]|nr:hypothetical protein [Bacteroidales bacterium]
MTLTGKNPFQKFYNTSVQIGKVVGGGSYENQKGEFKILDEVIADLQPYNGGLALEEYGFKTEVNKRMYCSKNKHLIAGNMVVSGDERYLIEYVESWGMGMTILLSEKG